MSDPSAQAKRNPGDYPIPSALNTILVVAVFAAQTALLVAASHVGWAWVIVLGILFASLGLTNYALMHEGSHRSLHARPLMNWFLGLLTGVHFPASFTLMKETHIVHHCCNRTDHEMFDLYYEGDNKVVKYAQWYSILLGLFWVIIPIGSLILALCPPLLRTSWFKQSRSSGVVFDPFGPMQQAVIILEVTLIAGWFWMLAHFAGLQLFPTLALFAMFGFNWSTRQYITHAWSERSVMHGAHNLKVSPVMSCVLLNGEWDRVHHENPAVPWLYLRRLGQRDGGPRVSYWRQYFSLWKGPRPATEPGPTPLKNTDLP